MSSSELPGLRERKKAKTRAAIQHHALRLFATQGYAQTTIDQIAQAAEVSPSTFFRYFPTKQAVAEYDPIDPIAFHAFQAQPAQLNPIQALRAAIAALRAQLSPAQLEQERQRAALVWSVPELRAASLAQLVGIIKTLADHITTRTGRDPDDFTARALAGAFAGISIAALTAIEEDPSRNLFDLIDTGLSYLEAGMPR